MNAATDVIWDRDLIWAEDVQYHITMPVTVGLHSYIYVMDEHQNYYIDAGDLQANEESYGQYTDHPPEYPGHGEDYGYAPEGCNWYRSPESCITAYSHSDVPEDIVVETLNLLDLDDTAKNRGELTNV